MARQNPTFIRFDGDNFTLATTITDTASLDGYKAETTIFTRDESDNITIALKKNTAGDFDPDEGGVTFDDNVVLTEITTADYTSLTVNTVYEIQVRLWDGDDVHAVSAYGKWDLRKPAPASTLT